MPSTPPRVGTDRKTEAAIRQRVYPGRPTSPRFCFVRRDRVRGPADRGAIRATCSCGPCRPCRRRRPRRARPRLRGRGWLRSLFPGDLRPPNRFGRLADGPWHRLPRRPAFAGSAHPPGALHRHRHADRPATRRKPSRLPAAAQRPRSMIPCRSCSRWSSPSRATRSPAQGIERWRQQLRRTLLGDDFVLGAAVSLLERGPGSATP